MNTLRIITLSIISLSSCLIASSCSHNVSKGSSAAALSKHSGVSSAPCIVYRTRKDYSHNVPVILSADRKQIVSYPGIHDLTPGGTLSLPTPLADGYLLDNRGIGPHVAFLRFTYEEYARLPVTPPATSLYDNILDDEPITVMYQCGSRGQYADIVSELNRMIKDGTLKSCKKLK